MSEIEQYLQDVKEIGREEGIAIGETRGIAIGQSRSKAHAINLAKWLLEEGKLIEEVAQRSGLDIAELEALRPAD